MKRFINCKVILALFFIVIFAQLPGSLADAQTIQNGIPEGSMIIEGDIIVPTNFYDLIGPSAIWESAFNGWGGFVPYVFDTNVSTVNQTLMLAAMAEWENVANVHFIPRNSEINFVRIRDSSFDPIPGNSSNIGVKGGEQVINITNWAQKFVMVHELGHTLGMWHEQSRPDRDNYIRINLDNILNTNNEARNFAIHSPADFYPAFREYGLSDEETYDFDSIMHYGQFAYSDPAKGGLPTITVLPPNDAYWQNKIGQRDHLSKLDKLTMSFLYPQANWYFVDQIKGWDRCDFVTCGDFLFPFRSYDYAVNNTPINGTLWIQPGAYSTVNYTVLDRPITLRAPLGNVTILR